SLPKHFFCDEEATHRGERNAELKENSSELEEIVALCQLLVCFPMPSVHHDVVIGSVGTKPTWEMGWLTPLKIPQARFLDIPTKPGSSWRTWVGVKVSNTIVLICSSVQIVINVLWLCISPPFHELDMHSYPGRIIIQCNEGSVIAFYSVLGYMGVLAAVSFIIAYFARTLPDSFNEAKYITFSMLVFCSVWIAMIPAYLSTKGKDMVSVEIFAILTSSAGLLGCIFFPKSYILLIKPEMNTRTHLMSSWVYREKKDFRTSEIRRTSFEETIGGLCSGFPGTYIMSRNVAYRIAYRIVARVTGGNGLVGFCHRSYATEYRKILAFFFAVDLFTKTPTILPNITLGYYVFDSCGKAERSVKNIFKILSGKNREVPNYSCWKQDKLAGFIGDLLSVTTIPMAQILSLYGYTQISYGATDTQLSDRTLYPYLFRTVQDDRTHHAAIVKLIKYFGWNWVGIIRSEDESGEREHRELSQALNSHGICIEHKILLMSMFMTIVAERGLTGYLRVTSALQSGVRTEGVPCSEPGLRINFNLYKDNLIMPSGQATETFWVIIKPTLALSVGLECAQKEMARARAQYERDTPYLALHVPTGILSPTLKEKLKCLRCLISLKLIMKNQQIFKMSAEEFCHQKEKRHGTAQQTTASSDRARLQALVQLKALNHDWRPCGRSPFGRSRERVSNGNVYLSHTTDEKGFLLNMLKQLVNCLSVHPNHMNTGPFGSERHSSPRPPLRGSPHPPLRGPPPALRRTCPYSRTSCRSEGDVPLLSPNSDNCQKCPANEWPDERKTKCIPRTYDFLSYEKEIITPVFSCISVLFSLITVFILGIFIVFRETPIVRANNRNLSFILLVSLMLSFLCVFLFLGRPVDITCMLRQTSFGIIFSVAVSSVLGKTIMVYIAFKATKPGSSWRTWVGVKVSNTIVLICSSIQILINVLWLCISPPFQELDMHSYPGRIIIQCNEGSVIAFYSVLGYMGVLAAVSFIIAYFARTLPDSFNEAKYITFSMLVFCSVWIAMIPAYLSTKGKDMVSVEIFAILTSSAGLLGCIFVPKMYILLIKPEMNTKRHLLDKIKL
ncbi:vomeronasal type-2 receptor 26-like, partial [Pelobates cultripes]